jgi:hypothetical protein
MSQPDFTSAGRATQAPRPTFSALLEVAGLWWLILCAGVLLITALLLNVHDGEVQRIQQSRVALSVAELQESIVTDAALGLDLAQDRAIQSRLEAALAADKTLHAIDMVNVQGVAMFSTDRGAIGERWPAAALAAAESGARRTATWSTNIDGETMTGQPLRNAFGEVIGHVSASYAAPPASLSLIALRASMPLWIAAAVSLLALTLIAVLAARWALAPQYRALNAEAEGAMHATLLAVDAVRARQNACLAQLDALEAAE